MGPAGTVLASRGGRFLANLIDLVCALVAIGALASVAAGIDADNGGLIGFFAVLGYLGILAAQFMLLKTHGQTIGKRSLDLRIVDATSGGRVGIGRIFFLRMVVPSLIGGVPYLGWVFGGVDAAFIFREDRRCVHDLIADTIVVQATAAN